MSAPAGWHLQPDGQERFWDGTAWTDHFRAPLPEDPTAPPPPSWAGSVEETQSLDVDSTRAIPASTGLQQPAQPQPGYPPPGYAPAGQPQTGYPQTGYGAPSGQPYGPPPRQGNGLAKGCLIAGLIGLLLLAATVVGGLFLFNRAADTISENFPSGFPTVLPSDFPSDLPSEGLGRAIDITVGDGFDLPRASIQPGWELEARSGVAVVQITGMKATLDSDGNFPVLFTMSFADAAGSKVETVCTAPSGASGATVDVSCVPLFGDVADVRKGTVTASL